MVDHEYHQRSARCGGQNNDVIPKGCSKEWSSRSSSRLYVVTLGIYSSLTKSQVLLSVCVFLFYTVGTYKLRDPAIIASVLDVALASGYRLIGK